MNDEDDPHEHTFSKILEDRNRIFLLYTGDDRSILSEELGEEIYSKVRKMADNGSLFPCDIILNIVHFNMNTENEGSKLSMYFYTNYLYGTHVVKELASLYAENANGNPAEIYEESIRKIREDECGSGRVYLIAKVDFGHSLIFDCEDKKTLEKTIKSAIFRKYCKYRDCEIKK